MFRASRAEIPHQMKRESYVLRRIQKNTIVPKLMKKSGIWRTTQFFCKKISTHLTAVPIKFESALKSQIGWRSMKGRKQLTLGT